MHTPTLKAACHFAKKASVQKGVFLHAVDSINHALAIDVHTCFITCKFCMFAIFWLVKIGITLFCMCKFKNYKKSLCSNSFWVKYYRTPLSYFSISFSSGMNEAYFTFCAYILIAKYSALTTLFMFRGKIEQSRHLIQSNSYY